MGSNSGGNVFFPVEIVVGTRPDSKTTTTSAASNIIFLQQGRKPRDKTSSEEDKQFHSGRKGEKPLPLNAAVMVLFPSLGGTLGHGRPAVSASFSLSVCACLSFHCLLFYQVIVFSAS